MPGMERWQLMQEYAQKSTRMTLPVLTIALLFVPFGGMLQTILARYAYGIAIVLAALLLGVVLAPFLGVWGALTVLLATLLAGALWRYRHTRFVMALGAAWRQ